eukprot:COSAG01_NODE_19025_length_1035_cov_2.669872_1_plen_120_part_00
MGPADLLLYHINRYGLLTVAGLVVNNAAVLTKLASQECTASTGEGASDACEDALPPWCNPRHNLSSTAARPCNPRNLSSARRACEAVVARTASASSVSRPKILTWLRFPYVCESWSAES